MTCFPTAQLPQSSLRGTVMERYLVELDEDQVELLSQMVREAIKVADEKKAPILEALLDALGNMRWKAGDRRTD